MSFKQVLSQIDFPALEQELLDYWYKEGIIEKYLTKNNSSDKKFSFLDGPITANNPMGVHHAWGRTYKDLWQRFFNMSGYKQRFQNGFDEQGLWVEVEVEKELGLKSKKDIENLVPGDKHASLEKFTNLCKQRVEKFSGIQTEQSKRLGYFMDWDNSYHTSSDENNYWIWHFLKTVYKKGWVYKGYDSVPWCPRCGTAISQHEIEADGYKVLTHESVYVEYPIEGRQNEYLLIWTTTPWTLPGNVAAAVDPNKDYVQASGEVADNKYYLGKLAAEKLNLKVEETITGKELVGLSYKSPFDHLPRIKKAFGQYKHQVIATDPLILPISDEEGTGIVHIAPGAGTEDFQLGKKLGLPVVELIDEEASYLQDLDEFSGKNAKNDPKVIFDYLKEFEEGEYLFDIVPFTHRYPTCWRCKTELVWRVVNEWYISADKKDDSGKTYREQMKDGIKNINWIPKWGYERELDWLNNLHDWLISKKRYWGLSLPIWECTHCGSFEVIGGYEELKERAVEGWDDFEGHSPHRPWIDQVKIKCGKCGKIVSRIPDVGNPWLDAGIVPFSTMPKEWFPADFVTESFPGQFKNWFYSLIAMSTALTGKNPFKNLLGFASVRDEKGEEMHKSKGNAIEFNEAASKIGADVMRWMYTMQNPENNLNFGFGPAGEIKRRFYLILWNSYKFFVDYANLADWQPEGISTPESNLKTIDKWIRTKLNKLCLDVNKSLVKFDAMTASRSIEDFVIRDMSTWYIRRSRDRVGTNVNLADQNAFFETLYDVLHILSRLLAPFVPFIAEEIYRNLTKEESVHLAAYPQGDEALHDPHLIEDMKLLRDIVEISHAKRKEANVKLRQPLASLSYCGVKKLDADLEKILADEINVKAVKHDNLSKEVMAVELDINITPELAEEGEARELIRQIQQQRKMQNLTLADKTKIEVASWPKTYEDYILKSTASVSIQEGSELKVTKI
ncbi:isoleucine--tRNA ligase [Candidatus Daviesbacteria bacterium]|nr:isoleucine--tRNA ligase [Candidatus Daviesbacteria bacterium]